MILFTQTLGIEKDMKHNTFKGITFMIFL